MGTPELWVKLASYNILKCIRGQQGGNHLRKHTIRVSETSKKQESVVLGDKGVNRANLLNIQASTLNSAYSSSLGTIVDNISKSKLKMIHVNIRSLRNSAHLIQLRELAVQQKLDVITVSETWLNSTVTNAEVSIDGYKLYRQDRLHKRGGGVCAFIREDIKVSILKDISQVSESYLQQLWLKMQNKKLKSIIVCVSYRPPDSPLSSFEDLLKPSYIQALTLCKPIVILGDLNCNVLSETVESKALASFMSDVYLSQVITTPTRITDTSSSLIDVILVSNPNIISANGVLNTPISDHLPVFVTLKLKLPKPPPCYITVRSYKKYDPTLFVADLASKSELLLKVFQEADVNSKLKTFNDVFYSTLESHAPVKTMRIRSRSCSYVTPEIKEIMIARDEHHRRFRLTREEADLEEYKESRNTVKSVLKDAEKDYVRGEVLAHKNNSGSLWKVINNSIPSKEKQIHVYSKDSKSVADDFNQFFSSVGRKSVEAAVHIASVSNIETNLSLDSTALSPELGPFTFNSVTCTEVQRIILSTMPSNKSPGPGKISMGVIKDSLPVILGPLTDIINTSFATSTFPEAWKIAEVIPLLKDGDHDVPLNNRPLSLLTVALKVCERIALQQFNSYLQRHNLLNSDQNGNKKNHST